VQLPGQRRAVLGSSVAGGLLTAAAVAADGTFGNPDQPAEGSVNVTNPKTLADPGPRDPNFASNEPTFLNPPANVRRFSIRACGDDRQLHAGDIGYVKKGLSHYLENTGNTDLVYMEVFRADRFERCYCPIGWRTAQST
jgi:hypothetical protein